MENTKNFVISYEMDKKISTYLDYTLIGAMVLMDILLFIWAVKMIYFGG